MFAAAENTRIHDWKYNVLEYTSILLTEFFLEFFIQKMMPVMIFLLKMKPTSFMFCSIDMMKSIVRYIINHITYQEK